jgi:pyruvate/2-oxoglutarate/acetoin dehydrogenase E1 component
MTKMTFAAAVRNAMAAEMETDPTLFIIGEDIGRYGGEFGATAGLYQRFGEDRVRDAPISETAIIGAGLGAAMTGIRAVAEIPFGDFLGMCMDQICNQAAKIRYMSGGQVRVPLVIRTTMGGYMSAGAQHSQCLESWFVHLPGIKVVVPSNPADAFGLLRSAMRDGNPVLFLEHKGLSSVKGEVPDDPDFVVPLGVAHTVREGSDVTVVATAAQVTRAVEAAAVLAERGISAEVIDPRTLDPLDEEMILASVRKTGRLVVVHEAWERGGHGGEIAAVVADQAFASLRGPIKRVAARNAPTPFSPVLEHHVLPSVNDIVEAAQATVAFEADASSRQPAN